MIKQLLATANPQTNGGRKVTVDEVLLRAERQIVGKFADEPAVEATIRQALWGLGLFARAEAQARRARGCDTVIVREPNRC